MHEWNPPESTQRGDVYYLLQHSRNTKSPRKPQAWAARVTPQTSRSWFQKGSHLYACHKSPVKKKEVKVNRLNFPNTKSPQGRRFLSSPERVPFFRHPPHHTSPPTLGWCSLTWLRSRGLLRSLFWGPLQGSPRKGRSHLRPGSPAHLSRPPPAPGPPRGL